MTDKMTRQERSDLSALIRKRERVLKAAAAERAAAMRAEFEKQCASIYSFDDDKVWKQVMAQVDQVVADAQAVIAARCAELGIPKEFAPGLTVGWYGRGRNAVKDRRGELREVAKTRIEAIQKETVTKIERVSLEAQSEVLVSGLESDAAKLFLSRMASIDEMMPALGMDEVNLLAIAGRTRS